MYYNDWRAAKVMDNKCFYPKMFSGVKQPEQIACRINGFWFDSDRNQVSFDVVLNLIERQPEVFIKCAQDSCGGSGVFFLANSAVLTEDDFVSRIQTCIEGISRDIVVQKPIKQHPLLAEVNTSSVNTIRVISLLRENGAKIYSSILRMGVNGAKVDNASSGGITCGITENGTLRNVGYYASGKHLDKHPSSGIRFSDVTVPRFERIQQLVEELHPQVPHFRLISWDFAVDSTGEVVLIEANLHYGELDFHQLNNGPLFGGDTKDILDEVYRKNRYQRTV